MVKIVHQYLNRRMRRISSVTLGVGAYREVYRLSCRRDRSRHDVRLAVSEESDPTDSGGYMFGTWKLLSRGGANIDHFSTLNGRFAILKRF